MGNTYFYGKIVSMFGEDIMNGKKSMNKIMSYMFVSEMMKCGNAGVANSNNALGSNLHLPDILTQKE